MAVWARPQGYRQTSNKIVYCAGMQGDRENIDRATVHDFGLEWQRFDQSAISDRELREIFDSYFAILPWEQLPLGAIGFDAGCGTGRWALLVAPRIGHLHCIDASDGALRVARGNLANVRNVTFHETPLGELSLPDASMDFGYSLGVLHHLPDPEAGLSACVRKLKSGAPMLIYIYYAFDNKPGWFRLVWRASDFLRRSVSRMPFRIKSLIAEIVAALVYWPLARAARFFGRRGRDVGNWPLSAYRERSFYSMRTDALDRFGTRLEHRMTRAQIKVMMERAGLQDVRFSDAVPFWCAVGHKA